MPNWITKAFSSSREPTALVADDDPQVRCALKTRLTSWGYRVVECRDGLSAIVKTMGDDVDVIILDHDMPLGQGQAIAGSLREKTRAPIIFLSGYDRREFDDTLNRTSETYYLPKPLDTRRLAGLLEEIAVCV